MTTALLAGVLAAAMVPGVAAAAGGKGASGCSYSDGSTGGTVGQLIQFGNLVSPGFPGQLTIDLGYPAFAGGISDTCNPNVD